LQGTDRMAELSLKMFVFGMAVALAVGRQSASYAQPAAPPAGIEDAIEPESPLLVEPKTPEEIFNAVDLMVRLARPKLARRYLEQFMKAKPNVAILLTLRDEHGPAIFLKLANIKELRPLSTQLLKRVNEAFRRQGADPKRLDALIAALSKSVEEREVALIALRSAGAVVVPRILQHLGDPAQTEQHDLLLYTLTRLGNPVIPPLLGALDAPNEHLRGVAIETLGWIGSPDVAPYLWYHAFAPKQPAGVQAAARQALARILQASAEGVNEVSSYGVAGELKRVALAHFALKHRWQVDEDDGTVAIWSWRAGQKTVGLSKLSPQAASLYVGTRFARQALAISPERSDLQALFVALTLASDRHRVGSDKPLPTGPGTAHDLALTAGRDVVAEALRQSLMNGNAASARAALQVLSQIATRHQLYSTDSRKSPIVSALNYPDSRVQFAAANTILQLDPDKPFRGAHRVVSILARALNDDGTARAVVVDVNTQRASSVAGLLDQLGYDTLIAPTGKDGFRIASERMDIELIVLEINTIRWSLSQTIANLRADARTAAIPIAIYGPATMRPRVEGLMQRNSLVTYIIKSVTAENLDLQLKPFLKTVQSPPLTPQQRTRQRATAAFWFAHIAGGKRTKLFNIAPAERVLFAAVNDQNLAGDALVALGAIATPTAQERFQEVAVSESRDPGLRETAALQLAFHIQRFGLLISRTQIDEIMASWQKAQNQHPDLATALASVVGSLKPNARRVDSRLKQFPLPANPTP